jgi:hypothetical protein
LRGETELRGVIDGVGTARDGCMFGFPPYIF